MKAIFNKSNFKIIVILLVLLLLITSGLMSQTLTIANNGSYSTSSSETYTDLSLGNSAVLTVNSGHTLTINGNATSNNGFGIIVEENATLIITGTLTGNNNINLNILGGFEIGSISISNNGSLTVGGTGVITINGNFTTGSGATIAVDGSLSVDGNLDLGTGSTITNDGSLSISGEYSGPEISGGGETILTETEIFSTATPSAVAWTCPDGVTSVTVEAWGAGGGAGNSNNAEGNGGGGGGGGAYSKRVITVVPGTIYYYYVGDGGNGGPGSSTTAAVDGQNSWFNSSNSMPSSDLSSNVLAAGGKKGANASTTGGGAGGTVANSYGSTKYAGGKGGNGGSSGGGGGGGSAGIAATGNNGANGVTGNPVAGGAAVTGGGAGGNGKGSYQKSGDNGSSPGGGGGAGDNYRTNSGGAGADGQIKLTYTVYSATIRTSGTLSAFTACIGSNSSEQNFTVSGVNLSANLVITPPTGYEISTTSGSNFTSSISLTPNAGTVSSTTIYVRTTTSAINGASGNISCTSTGVTTQNVATGSATISNPGISSHPTGANICTDGSYTASVTASGGTGLYTYQWYSNASNSNSGGSLISGANSFSYSPSTSVAGTYYFYCIVSSCSQSATSNVATLTINSIAIITAQPLGETICYGGSYNPSVSISGGSSSLTYQWKYATTIGGTYNNVTNGSPTNSSYTNGTSANLIVTGNISAGSSYYYKCYITDAGSGCSNLISNAANLVVRSNPTISSQPSTSTQSVCPSSSATSLTVTAAAGSGTISTYQWFRNSTNSNSGGTTVGTSSNSYTPSESSGTYYYYVTITNSNGCSTTSNVSGAITFTVPTTRYYVANNGWGSTLSWAATSEGVTGASIPTCGGDVVIELGGTYIITGVTSVSLSSFKVTPSSSNIDVTLRGTGSASLTLGGNSGTDFSVQLGSILRLEASSANTREVNIVMASGSTAIIDGDIFTTYSNSTYNTLINITDVSEFTISTSGKLTDYFTTNCFTGNSSSNLKINGTYVCTQNGATIPTAIWGSSSLCSVTGRTGSSINGTAQNFGDFIWDCSGHTNSTQALANGFGCQGDFTLINDGNQSVTTSGNVTIGGDIIISSGTTLYNSSSNYTLTIVGTITISGTLDLNSGSGMKTFTGNITINSGGVLIEKGNASIYFLGNISNDGTYTNLLNTTGIHYVSNTNAVISGTGTSNSNIGVTFNRVTFDGGGTKILNCPLTVSTLLTLTSGIIDATSNDLSFTSSASVTGASDASHVKGVVNKNTTNTSQFIFPVGDGTTYSPIAITPNSTSSTNWEVTYSNAAYSDLSIDASGLDHVSSNEYWDLNRVSGTANAVVEIWWTSVDNVTDYNDLAIAHYNGVDWEMIATSPYGTNISGYIRSQGPVTNFSPFTIGTTSNVNALPVALVMFKGEEVDQKNKLIWQVASEKNVDYFIIEKTKDGQFFEFVGSSVSDQLDFETHDYTLMDEQVSPIINYYRLIAVDLNGVQTKYNLISVDNRSMNVDKELLKITNMWGQDIQPDYKGQVIYIYTDGSIERTFKFD